MVIEHVEAYYFDYPLSADFHPAWVPGHTQTANRCVICKLISDGGHVGLGACSVFNEDQARLGKFIAEDTIGRLITGVDPNETELVARIVKQYALMLGGRPWAIEVALWDLLGQAAGKPLYQLWGGTAASLPLYASTGETVTAKSPEQALAAKEAGFNAIKLRAHNWDVNDDINHVCSVRAVVGDAMKIMVDANQGWTLSPLGPIWDFDTALAFAKGVEDCDITWLEEPLDRFDFDGLARLRKNTRIPIAGGEMNQGIHEFKILFEKDSLDVYQPDATLAGGVDMTREVARMSHEKGLTFSPHTWTNGIGFAINMHIAAAASNCPILEFPYEPTSWSPAARDAMLTKPFLPTDGSIHLPTGPGLGIALNDDAMKEFGKRL